MKPTPAKVIIWILLLLALVLAVGSLQLAYVSCRAKGLGGEWLVMNWAYGYELKSAYFAILIQVVVSVLLLTLSRRTATRVNIVLLAILQLCFLLIYVQKEVTPLRYFDELPTHFEFGIWLLIGASGSVIAASLINFFDNPEKSVDSTLLDENL